MTRRLAPAARSRLAAATRSARGSSWSGIRAGRSPPAARCRTSRSGRRRPPHSATADARFPSEPVRGREGRRHDRSRAPSRTSAGARPSSATHACIASTIRASIHERDGACRCVRRAVRSARSKRGVQRQGDGPRAPRHRRGSPDPCVTRSAPRARPGPPTVIERAAQRDNHRFGVERPVLPKGRTAPRLRMCSRRWSAGGVVVCRRRLLDRPSQVGVSPRTVHRFSALCAVFVDVVAGLRPPAQYSGGLARRRPGPRSARISPGRRGCLHPDAQLDVAVGRCRRHDPPAISCRPCRRRRLRPRGRRRRPRGRLGRRSGPAGRRDCDRSG